MEHEEPIVMTDKARIHRVIDELNLPIDRYVLAGSAVMTLHGMDRRPRDLDIFTTTRQWFNMLHLNGSPLGSWNVWTPEPDDKVTRCDPPYLHRSMHGLDVTVYFHWRQRGVGDIDSNFWMHNAQLVDGIPCLPLSMLLAWKDSMGRAKDAIDIEAIRNFLKETT